MKNKAMIRGEPVYPNQFFAWQEKQRVFQVRPEDMDFIIEVLRGHRPVSLDVFTPMAFFNASRTANRIIKKMMDHKA